MYDEQATLPCHLTHDIWIWIAVFFFFVVFFLTQNLKVITIYNVWTIMISIWNEIVQISVELKESFVIYLRLLHHILRYHIHVCWTGVKLWPVFLADFAFNCSSLLSVVELLISLIINRWSVFYSFSSLFLYFWSIFHVSIDLQIERLEHRLI